MEDQYRILLVCRPGPQGDAWEKALSDPSIRIVRALDGEQGLRRLEKEPVQALLSEIHPQRIAIEHLLETAGRILPCPLRIVLADSPAAGEINQCLQAGFDRLESRDQPPDDFASQLRAILQKQAVVPIEDEAAESSPLDRLVGRSAAMAEVKRRIGQMASAPSAVLFTGETGTGKTLAAEVLHAVSERTGNPFIRVYCPALSRTLIESELFGHEKGAFTDAKTVRQGVFERAAGGTVLMEEVGDLPGPTQSAILRLLETGEMRRIGSSRALRPDVRLLFATAEPLEALSTRGGIRKSLLYRIEGVRLDMPALRERPEDIPDLIRYFIPRLCRSSGFPIPKITRRAVQRLARLEWPGNVRQLQNTLEGILAASGGEPIDIAHIPLHLRGQTIPSGQIVIPVGSSLAEAERQLIAETLKTSGGSKTRAAQTLGIGLRTLYRKMKLYGI